MRPRYIVLGAVLACFALAQPAEAAVGRAIGSLFSAIFRLPLSVIAGTFNGPPVIGTLMGAVNGLFGTVGLIGGGAAELGMSALSIAKTVGPILLPFLL